MYLLIYTPLVGKIHSAILLPLIGPRVDLVRFPWYRSVVKIKSCVVILSINEPKEPSAALLPGIS
jgi:hypothetical protein